MKLNFFTLLFLGIPFLILSLSISVSASLNYSSMWSQNLTGASIDPAIAFGDIDNDGDSDLITIGCLNGDDDVSCNSYTQTKIYTNNGTTLTENQTWQQNLKIFELTSISVGL